VPLTQTSELQLVMQRLVMQRMGKSRYPIRDRPHHLFSACTTFISLRPSGIASKSGEDSRIQQSYSTISAAPELIL
jgi:hypothetical protein